MSATATREAVAETPPDTRGPTAREPMAILITGWVSVGAAIGGTLLLTATGFVVMTVLGSLL